MPRKRPTTFLSSSIRTWPEKHRPQPSRRGVPRDYHRGPANMAASSWEWYFGAYMKPRLEARRQREREAADAGLGR